MVATITETVKVSDPTIVYRVQEESYSSKRRKSQIKKAQPAKVLKAFALYRKVVGNHGKVVLNAPVRVQIPDRKGFNVYELLEQAGWNDIKQKPGSPILLGTAPAGTIARKEADRLVVETPGGSPFCLLLVMKGSEVDRLIPACYNTRRHSRKPRRSQRRNRRQN